MQLRINQLAFGLGSGVLGATSNRMGVWTQGCSLSKCPGCTSAHTWSPQGGKVFAIRTLLDIARAQPLPPLGLTLSGGEPSDQAPAVAALIRGFRELFPDAEVVMYSGLRWPVLSSRHPELVALLDVAVTGPYVRTLEATPLAGSSNQEVVLLTPLAEHLYRDWPYWPKHVLQVGRGDGRHVVTVGIPHTPRMANAAQEADVANVTWDQSSRRKA
jgi:anaerobic ribonucleoside-triphosphate reductase activating protein